MTNLLQRALRRDITSIDDYIAALSSFTFKGANYSLLPQVQQTLTGDRAEVPGADLVAFGRRLYADNGIVFACMSLRALVFSSVRVIHQRMQGGRPSAFFGKQSLSVFEEPWPGGTTQDLLALMIQDVDLAGNSYWVRTGSELVRLRPDWVQLVMERRRDGLGHRKVALLYHDGGIGVADAPVAIEADRVAHFMQQPDPFEPWKGMSWLRTVFSEVANDRLMERHKSRVFENGATPNMVIKFPAQVDEDAFDEFVEKFRTVHEGAENAGKTLFLSDGADMEVVGRDFQQLDFRNIQGAAETRIAAAAGVPPVIVGFSEGLKGSSLNAGNYGAARRRFADATMHPLWQHAAGSLSALVPRVSGARLWYDTRDVPFIREDEKDVADIQQARAITIRNLTDAGYTADSVVEAVEADDFALLQHSGLFSVQLQPPGSSTPAEDAAPADGDADPEEPAGDPDE